MLVKSPPTTFSAVTCEWLTFRSPIRFKNRCPKFVQGCRASIQAREPVELYPPHPVETKIETLNHELANINLDANFRSEKSERVTPILMIDEDFAGRLLCVLISGRGERFPLFFFAYRWDSQQQQLHLLAERGLAWIPIKEAKYTQQ